MTEDQWWIRLLILAGVVAILAIHNAYRAGEAQGRLEEMRQLLRWTRDE